MNHRECWQPCWPYTPARETRGQPSIAPTMPTNTAQSDPTEPLKTADLPLHYAENGTSTGAHDRRVVDVRHALSPPTGRSGNINTNNHRRELGLIQAVALGSSRQSRTRRSPATTGSS